MTEDFIHYLWQFQQFDRTDLQTDGGESLQVVSVGKPHTHAGADFQQARLLIGGLEWVGSVEIHLRSSDWYRHTHDTDAAYENVILHVVWKHDEPVTRSDGSVIPVLSLQQRTDLTWLDRYKTLIEGREPIACGERFRDTNELTKRSMLDRAMIQRLHTKAEKVRIQFESVQHNWEETCWRTLARALGSPLNAEPMEWLASTVPIRILQKHRDQVFQLEALLFGGAGLIPDTPADPYTVALKKEADFLIRKYQLTPLPLKVWKFLRLRPASFPTIRIAQLAQLIQSTPHLFSLFSEPELISLIRKQWTGNPSEYWREHYTFGKPSDQGIMRMGTDTLHRLLINAVSPVLAAVARYRDEEEFMERAIALLEQLPAENHQITQQWKAYGLSCQNAADSQGALEWMQLYCEPRKCLSCSVGLQLLKQK